MALSLLAIAILAFLPAVRSQWSCSAGMKAKSGEPTCAGAVGTTCSDMGCCESDSSIHLCPEYAAAWAISQLVGAGCKVDNKFFDLKKTTTEVGGTQTNDDIKAACCTPFADATCGDWLKVCTGSGNYQVITNSAPGGSSGDIAADDFQTKCCSDKAKCSAHTCSAGTKKSSAGSIHCAGDVASCTDFACCDAPKTCASYTALWLGAQLLGGGCSKFDKFLDLTKNDVTVGGSQSEDDIKAACCTAFADATCENWNTMTCLSGHFRDQAVAAPADGPATGTKKTLTTEKFRELCCKPPMKCSAYVAEAETDVAFFHAFPYAAFLVSLVGLYVL